VYGKSAEDLYPSMMLVGHYQPPPFFDPASKTHLHSEGGMLDTSLHIAWLQH
jgi:hypothetical protein